MCGALAALTVLSVGTGLAEDFDISRWTIDGGGAMRSTGGDFELSGTIGQPDARTMSGDGFDLTGGFWFETPPGDCNDTGCVDLIDYADIVDEFEPCLSGPDGSVPFDCRCFDIDRDSDVDLLDIAQFQNAFTGG